VKTRSPMRRGAALLAFSLAILVSMALAACSAKSTGSSAPGAANAANVTAQNSSTLTVAIATAPLTLNPALAGENDPLDIAGELAYDPLIYREPNGTLVPGLATKWGYVGTGNNVFDLTLRSGVKFSDGSALTAAGVKAYFAYFAKSGGIFADYAAFASVTVTGPLSLQIKLASPDPELADKFTQDLGVGNVISPIGLKNVAALGTSTAGAGQYVLDQGATVTGQTYTFTSNANYWNPSAIHWKKIVVTVISSPTAALDAMQSGQVDYMLGNAQTAAAAKTDGFTVTSQPNALLQVALMDRSGQATKALGNLKVRQALNYAIDRPQLAAALYGTYAQASQQFSLPGSPYYQSSLANYYPYDPAKAKQLLAQAGYPNGFSLTMYAFNLTGGESTAAQAVASYWSKIGVNVNITVPTSLGAGIKSVIGKQFATQVYFMNNYTMYLNAQQLLGTTGDFYNPFGDSNPTFESLQAQAAAAADGAKIYQQLQTAMVQNAWFVPLMTVDKVVISRPGLEGIEMTPNSLNPDPAFFRAS
jgi:ABC-type transport system substrate-binding protein